MSQEALKAALLNTIGNIKENPASANVVFRASTRLVEGVRCSASVRNFPELTVDEPPELGGRDAGINPVELVLAALGTCQEIMYSAYASVMDIPLDSVKVELKGYLDLHGLFGMTDAPAGYKNIRFETKIESSADPEKIQQLIETVESHCPVLDTLIRSIDVSGTASLNGSPIQSVPSQATG